VSALKVEKQSGSGGLPDQAFSRRAQGGGLAAPTAATAVAIAAAFASTGALATVGDRPKHPTWQ